MTDWPRELSRRLRFLIHRQLFESDLDEEMRLHKQLREQEYRNEGVDAPSAAWDNGRALAGVTTIYEGLRS